MHSPFDLLALLLVVAAGLAYLNHRLLRLPLTIGLLVGAVGGTLALIALDAALPALGLKPAIRALVASVNSQPRCSTASSPFCFSPGRSTSTRPISWLANGPS
ncbi:MAG: hypothetical protein WDN69_14420 [Aliidongia sp.]